MLKQFDMVMLSPMNYNNTYALAVSEDLAETYQLQTISDLKSIEQAVKAGFTLEFNDREDGYVGIQKRYDIAFPSIATMEPKLRYQAIESGDINLLDAYSTDSEIRQYKLHVLEDDQALFPPYQGAPLLRQETLIKYPEIETSLNKLADQISDDEMREMNYQVNVEGKLAAEVANEYLVNAGLLK